MNILFDIARFRTIQIVVFGSFFMGIFYFTMYNDGSVLKKTIADVETNINQVEEQVNKTQKDLEDVENFEKEILAQEEAVKYFLNFIPSSLTFTEVSTLLIKEAKSAGVNIEVKQDKRGHKQNDSEYQTLDVQLTVNGAFAQILLFLSNLTNQKRIIIVNNIDMKVDRVTQLIGANLNISAYRYEKDKSSKGK